MPRLPRNSQTADAIKSGVLKVLAHHHNAFGLTEMTLKNDRRADIFAVGPKGEIYIVEVKSSVQDFKTDNKWPSYTAYCDYFYFAVSPDFPDDILPSEMGLIFADAFGGDVMRAPKATLLSAARRKALLIQFARLAARRYYVQLDHHRTEPG